MSDARNPRIDNLPQPQSNTSAFDTSSPGSIDFNFPFAGSPHGSSNSGIDAPPDIRLSHSQGFPGRGSMVGYAKGKIPSPQHRASLASIDSAFDHDLFGAAALSQWAPGSGNQPPSNADSSPRKAPSTTEQENRKPQGDDEKPPAWSELKTKAGKERKRLPLACIACRRKKIRCSGEKPACKHCLRARIPCVYKVTTRKAAPRTDYMAMLDKRLKRMEDRVIRVIPKDELPDLNATGRGSVRPPLPGQALKKEKDQPKKRSADEAFTQELNDWRSSREKSTLLDPTAGLRKQREGENKLFIEGSESLPPQHIQEHLAEVFFDCVYGQSYLLLHKPSFMRKLKAGTIPPVLILAVCAISARFSTHPQVSTEPAFLRGEQWATPARRIVEKRHYEPNITILTAMLMLGLHYFGTCEGGLSWSFGGQAMRMGYALQLHRELDHDPLGRNQIANNSNENKKGGPKPPELSFTDREIRRRTMWACYLMDTFNSSGTERPSFLNEDYYQIQLPIKESHFQMEVPGATEDLYGNVPMSSGNKSSLDNNAGDVAAEAKANMGVAAYIVRGVVLWKRIVKYLNLGGKEKDPHPIWDPLSQFATLQRQISQLKSSLPDDITYTPENLATHASERLANQYLLLHIILAQTSLFLHRFAIPTQPSHRPHHHYYTQQGMPKAFLTASANIVLESASLISKLIADATGHTLTVPFAGYCAYAAATVHVWGIFSKNSALEQQSKENLRHNYKYLTRMKRYWGMFHYMAESVKDIYRAFADATLRHAQARPGPNGIGALRRHSSATGGGGGGAGGGGSGTQTPMELDATATLMSNTNPPSRSDTPADPNKPQSEKDKSKTMFQYGDWFDKYPHGVSESEWEKSHLEYRSEHAQGGAEAVMSQRSDLQSVEEFFASLSPPSKAEDGAGGLAGRGKKIPRRRGKSVAENKKADKEDKGEKSKGNNNNTSSSTTAAAAGAGSGAGSSTTELQDSQRRQSVSQQLAGQHLPTTSAADLSLNLNLNQPFDLASFDITSPSLYQNAQFSDPYTYGGSPTSPHYNSLSFISTLPAIDRQMVFGAAYAGMDPTGTGGGNSGNQNNASSGLNNLNSPSVGNFASTNPWDQLDLTTYGFNDPFAGGGTSGMDTSSSAWLLPFNIEPPNFGGGGLEEFGNSALDGMDLSDLGQGGDDVGGQFGGEQNSGNT
ncbi:uncharacterized protein Z520_03848 [Fonsecaea multimorphosa CBS 102226]|uniref:Zn(2)-C6 fungal-type domain-containing protein n=1 Tax=Fonsecaea multimorphosa CBS 102226 TaxID=1442371 RepID=A0A0D2K2S7_9EURO|nr:uncharacterized protein Z520_03848 [Fonsecaea multimorphosa CBS 102226]KIY00163.1 hypothetical protein Z520_03848 [Fonsecaea multimorphosa CBS 102226]OAL27357.1 hypothetical protein AYO22_03632 [Fonsecaea multimorphosa]